MAEIKTKKNMLSVEDFLNNISDDKKKADSLVIDKMMQEIVGEKGSMWGSSIIGYGSYHYKYKSGREGDWMYVGFSPRKQQLTLYIMPGFDEYQDLLTKLGKHSTGKSCLYIKKLEDIDMSVLKQIVTKSVKHMRDTNN